MLAFPCSKKRQLICSKFVGGGSMRVLQQEFDQKSPNKFSIIWIFQLHLCTYWEDLTPYWSSASPTTGNSFWNCSYATISGRKSLGMIISFHQQANLLLGVTKPRLLVLWNIHLAGSLFWIVHFTSTAMERREGLFNVKREDFKLQTHSQSTCLSPLTVGD